MWLSLEIPNKTQQPHRAAAQDSGDYTAFTAIKEPVKGEVRATNWIFPPSRFHLVIISSLDKRASFI